jgi:hypothetical protein
MVAALTPALSFAHSMLGLSGKRLAVAGLDNTLSLHDFDLEKNCIEMVTSASNTVTPRNAPQHLAAPYNGSVTFPYTMQRTSYIRSSCIIFALSLSASRTPIACMTFCAAVIDRAGQDMQQAYGLHRRPPLLGQRQVMFLVYLT